MPRKNEETENNQHKKLHDKIDIMLERFVNEFDRVEGELGKFRDFLESLLVLLVRISLVDNPIKRLELILKATTGLPKHIYKIYVEEIIDNARQNNIEFTKLSDVLIRVLGDEAKELEFQDIIERTYGKLAKNKWQRLLKQRNPSTLEKEVIYFE